MANYFIMLLSLALVYGVIRNTRKNIKLYKGLSQSKKKIKDKERSRTQDKDPGINYKIQKKEPINKVKEMTYRLDKEEVTKSIRPVVDLSKEDHTKLGSLNKISKAEILADSKAENGKKLVLAYELMAGPLSRRKRKTR